MRSTIRTTSTVQVASASGYYIISYNTLMLWHPDIEAHKAEPFICRPARYSPYNRCNATEGLRILARIALVGAFGVCRGVAEGVGSTQALGAADQHRHGNIILLFMLWYSFLKRAHWVRGFIAPPFQEGGESLLHPHKLSPISHGIPHSLSRPSRRRDLQLTRVFSSTTPPLTQTA